MAKQIAKAAEEVNELKAQPCPVCQNKTLNLTETAMEVPFFGTVYLFAMTCTSCKYHKSDVEAAEQRPPCKCTFEVSSKEDLSIRIVKSAEATVKFAHVGSIEPGPASQGYITNIEGLINRMKEQVEAIRDTSEEEEDRKKAKNIIKKLQRVLWGSEKLKITIEDPTGNSAIISEKTGKK